MLFKYTDEKIKQPYKTFGLKVKKEV